MDRVHFLLMCLLLALVLLSGCDDEGLFIPPSVAVHGCTATSTVTPELASLDTSATPRQLYPDAEILALEASGEVMAPPELFDRVRVEAEAIRELRGSRMPVLPCAGGLILVFDAATYAEVQAGSYRAWDGLNGNLRASVTLGGGNRAVLDFAGNYHYAHLLRAYAALPGVTEAGLNTIIGASGDSCLARRGGTHYYIGWQGAGDCPAGCIENRYTLYAADAGGNVRKLEEWNGQGGAPDWFVALEDCRAYLYGAYPDA